MYFRNFLKPLHKFFLFPEQFQKTRSFLHKILLSDHFIIKFDETTFILLWILIDIAQDFPKPIFEAISHFSIIFKAILLVSLINLLKEEHYYIKLHWWSYERVVLSPMNLKFL